MTTDAINASVGCAALSTGRAGRPRDQHTPLRFRIDPAPEVGAVTESDQVTPDAPLLDTTKVALGQMVSNAEIDTACRFSIPWTVGVGMRYCMILPTV